MKGFRNAEGEVVVRAMIKTVQENAAHLSEIDGAIGDGDHGINMKKGFTICAERLDASPGGFTHGLEILGGVLMAEIGGSMGPLYGTFFRSMAKAGKDAEVIDAQLFGEMLASAVDAATKLGGAKVGDKTLVDVLVPARDVYREAAASGRDFAACLHAMTDAAEKGKESTKELVAKLGRASRLGERSRGTIDAGASSCALLLDAMATSIEPLLR